MCLITCQVAGSEPLADSIFENGWSANPNGAGYMFAARGKLVIRKPFYKLKHLKKAYMADHAAYGVESPFVVHFRWSTHGHKGEVNVHPHALCRGSVGLVHNGILPFDPPSSEISDTVFFCRTVMGNRDRSQLMSIEFGEWLAEMIGPANKLVLMAEDGNVIIVNEESGHWDGGTWYSNTSYAVPALCKWRPSKQSALPRHYRDTNGESMFGFGPAGDYDQMTEEEWRWNSVNDEEVAELMDIQEEIEFEQAMLRDGK